MSTRGENERLHVCVCFLPPKPDSNCPKIPLAHAPVLKNTFGVFYTLLSLEEGERGHGQIENLGKQPSPRHPPWVNVYA